ncbi:TIR domain-containing protein [Martelella radicis]|uniref:TIR domain-containing protein n=1 Tax=Martelella radicis TaxID=1397476 RepID=UPI003CCCDB4E
MHLNRNNHADVVQVTQLTTSLARRGYEIRNSSIRAKPENQRRLYDHRASDRTLKRLMRMKLNWASTVIVLIETHVRPWVDSGTRKASALLVSIPVAPRT